jgi:predicted ATP-binding protein involved in virulence
MYKIDFISITGMRGAKHPLNITFNNEVNFLIGRNGTGKTTAINLINAALSANLPELINSKFDEIEIKLKKVGSNVRPTIKYKRFFDSKIPAPQLSGEVRIKASATPVKFNTLDIGFRNNIYRELTNVAWSDYTYFEERERARRFNLRRNEKIDSTENEFKDIVLDLVKTRWLSVHRSTMDKSNDRDSRFVSQVDKKVHEVSRDFGAYFSTLDKLSVSETDKFQKTYFLSMVSPPKIDSMDKTIALLDVDSEIVALKSMFDELGLIKTHERSRLDNFMKSLQKVKTTYKAGTTIAAKDFLTLTDALRVHQLVEEWNKLVNTRETIYSPKNDFVNSMNSLFYRKKLKIDAGNEPRFESEDGSEIPVELLSSGEKQMFILLGETLTQRGAPCVFIADEPELSLHIEWQEKLVPSLRAINPNAQIVFATHSPDIVGAFGERTFDLEKLL